MYICLQTDIAALDIIFNSSNAADTSVYDS